MTPIGLGDPKARLAVFNANRPPLELYQNLNYCKVVEHHEIKTIADLTGNHWRKIFNCYAKLAFELNPQCFKTWQDLRDECLLQRGSGYGLYFSPPQVDNRQIKIVSGKQYWDRLNLNIPVQWIDSNFAVCHEKRLIVSPYFDYRQLSNAKITQLVSLINQFD
ncbi:MAG: hypothetical protein OQJ89_14100, partial [Kangiellaceae bacterium]|nr:hypothetical protein [Kangiellaceae bacterium]MCW8998171.1 hypothetical protein [Kangiellaceae bacterium]MCW9018099.1 hypothetical protein [Kangiellaceae bacterium]